MRVPCNLNNVKEITPREVGTYPVRVNGEVEIIEEEDKTPYLKIPIYYLDPECPRENQKTVFRVYASKSDGWDHYKVKELCQAFDVPFDTDGFDTADFNQREGYVSIEKEVYMGKTRNAVSHWLRNVA